MIPPKVILQGDKVRAEALRAAALSQLRILQERMTFRDLKQDTRKLVFEDGRRIEVRSVFGIDTVTIYVPEAPIEEAVEVEEEEVLGRATIDVPGSTYKIGTGTPEVEICVGAEIGEIETEGLKNICALETIDLAVAGGAAPYTWSVDNYPEFRLMPGAVQELETSTGGVSLATQGGNCDICGTVKVLDVCGAEATLQLCTPATEAALAWDWDNSDEEMGRFDTADVCVKGGAGPYEWSISGTGFFLQESTTEGPCNVVQTSNGAGTGVITVTDCCGDSLVDVYAVRCTWGKWTFQSYTCSLGGIPQENWTGGGGIEIYRRTTGGMRQTESIWQFDWVIPTRTCTSTDVKWQCLDAEGGGARPCDPKEGLCLTIPMWENGLKPPDYFEFGPCHCHVGATYIGCYYPDHVGDPYIYDLWTPP